MYQRCLSQPDYSFFLFGPRGTGKTTWLREKFPDCLWFNLLLDSDFLPLLGETEIFRRRVLSQPPGSWVVVDEVQKLPGLLNEVHDLISRHGKKYLFALSGSSARKLKRLNVNLLAGRVLDRRFFPLTSEELGEDFSIEKALSTGSLPVVCQERKYSPDILESYVGTYLREEIQQEALVENLESFGRFLKVAAVLNGSVLQISSVARECGVARKSAERYFQTLVDTLVGFFLPAWQPHVKVRESQRPKFYFFDPGVVRALTSRVRFPLHDLEKGILLETYILHELRASVSYLQNGAELAYYGRRGEEADLIINLGGKIYGIEIKASGFWRREYGKTLRKLLQEKKIVRAIGVYTGEKEIMENGILVLPVDAFLKRLWEQTIFE